MEQVIEGLVQGLTEFLPISSSGHVVFLEKIRGYSSVNLAQLQVSLHMGTLLSILVFYFADLKSLIINFSKNRKTIFHIIIGTIPLLFMYFFFYDFFKNILDNSSLSFSVASRCMFITAFLLLMTKFLRLDQNKKLTYRIVLVIGCMQCLAIFPGISRSGITICSALILGIGSKEAAKFSFFLAIPAILGASIIEFGEVLKDDSFFPYIAFLTSFIVGYISLRLLIFIAYSGKIWIFSIYCFAIGLISTFLL
tara:strand:+ start:119 stop:874 length:756 start_codon:yes stop_codon:yes gene_type:complete